MNSRATARSAILADTLTRPRIKSARSAIVPYWLTETLTRPRVVAPEIDLTVAEIEFPRMRAALFGMREACIRQQAAYLAYHVQQKDVWAAMAGDMELFDDLPMVVDADKVVQAFRNESTAPDSPITLAWKQMYNMREQFPNIYLLGVAALVVPCSNAGNERAFSVRTLIKTKNRASLHAERLNWCMHVSINTGGLYKFDFQAALARWKNEGNRHIYVNMANKISNLDLDADRAGTA